MSLKPDHISDEEWERMLGPLGPPPPAWMIWTTWFIILAAIAAAFIFRQ